MMEIVLEMLGFMLLWAGVNIGRQPESELKFLSGKWWLVLILISAGVNLLRNYNF